MFEGKLREGAVRVRASGGWIERFINRCLQEEITLWQIETNGEDTLFWMRLSDYCRVRPIAADSRVRLRIVERRGCPFVLRKLRHRKGLVIGPILCGVLLYLATLFVWQVEVVGNHTVQAEDILQLAKEENIYAGAWRSSIQSRKAQEAIVAKCSSLVWCGVHRDGGRVTIEVVEKTKHRTDISENGDIVARQDGILTELIVLRGTAVKAVGDTVRAGETLIAGYESVAIDSEQDDEMARQAVGAGGIVRARVWYEGYGRVQRETIRKERTGREGYGFSVQAGDTHWTWQSEKISRFASYETDKTVWQKRNQFFPVEIITNIYYECEPIREVLSEEEAMALAKQKAWDSIAQKIPKDARIRDRKTEIMEDASTDAICVRAWIETEEEIGSYSNRVSEVTE